VCDTLQPQWLELVFFAPQPMQLKHDSPCIVRYAFGLSPQQFVSVMNRATAETSVEQASAEGLMPILCYLADTINFIVQRCFGYSNLEFVWDQDRTINSLDQAKIDEIYVRSGVLSIDEVREELGKHPVGARNAVITATGLVPVDQSKPGQASGEKSFTL